MKLYKLGDTSKGICSNCAQIRPLTFLERNVPLSSGKGTVHDVLVGVCDVCKEVVSIPHQSVPRIQATVRASRHSVETRVPRHLLDALGLVCSELGFGTESSSVVFRYYLRRAVETSLKTRLASLANSDEASGKASARFSAKLSEAMYKLLLQLEQSGVKQADVVKGLMVQMKKDILDEKREDVKRELRSAMQLVA